MTHKTLQDSNVASPSPTAGKHPHAEKGGGLLHTRFGKCLPYLLSFLCLWGFCTFTYGEVFTRCVQESFISSDAELMKHLTDQEYGTLYLFGRYLLLAFHNPWTGGLLFSLMLTAAVRLLDAAFRLPRWLRGASALLPFGLLAYFVHQGISLYYKNEPSLFVLQATGLFAAAALLALAARFLPRKAEATAAARWQRWPIGTLVVLAGFLPLHFYARHCGENTFLTAKMQNRILDNDTFSLVEDGLQAKQPTRAVAAYYAIGLLQTNQMLERLFDISFHFPEVKLKQLDGTNEYGIFNADCNFFCGLVNSSYHAAMDQLVMNGPRLYYLKRMALCALLNGEKALAEKYLTVISQVPLEKDFVETYRPMADNPELLAEHPVFGKVLALKPIEQRFEQNYRTPTFLGYSIGMMQGSNLALDPSIAACLYSKDLPNLALRAAQYKRIHGNLPLSVMEALTIHGRKHPDLYQYFPELDERNQRFMNPAIASINNFYLAIQNYFQSKYNNAPDWRQKMSAALKEGIDDELRAQLAPEWVGHYVYYYYCENVKPRQQEKQENHSVN